jgi:hypothetical protein
MFKLKSSIFINNVEENINKQARAAWRGMDGKEKPKAYCVEFFACAAAGFFFRGGQANEQ